MDILIGGTLVNCMEQMRSQQSFYRNRSECTSYNYVLPILQPDLYITNSYDGITTRLRAIGITYETYREYSEEGLKNTLTAESVGCPDIPHYLLINMYGHMEEWDNVIAHLQRLVPELEVRNVEGMLIGHPNHKITLLQADNSFVILTNSMKKDLFPKLNAAFYYLREQQGLLIPEAESSEAYKEIRDAYVDTILTCTNADRMEALYQALEIEQIELRKKKEHEQEKQNSVKLFSFLQDKLDKNGIDNLQTEVSHIDETIRQYLIELRKLNNKRKQKQLYLAGIKQLETDENVINFIQTLQDDYEAESLIGVTITNPFGDRITCKDVSLIDALAETGSSYNVRSIKLQSKSIMHYWNEEYASVLLENENSMVHNYGDEAEALFEAIFIDKTVQLRVAMAYKMSYDADNMCFARLHRDGDSVLEFTEGCPHPHIMGYDCWGDNAANIQQALSRNDLYTAYMICKQVLESVALSDGAVVERMLSYWVEQRTNDMAKFFLIDGKAYNLRDAYVILCKKLAEEKAEAATETSENAEQ